METTTPLATQKPRLRGIGRAAAAIGYTPQWLRQVINGEKHSPEALARYEAFLASEAAAVARITKQADLEIVDRLRHLEFVVASGNVPKQNRPRFALLLWEIEKHALLWPEHAPAAAPEPLEGDWRTEPTPVPAPPDPVDRAIRAIYNQMQADTDAKVEAAIQVLLQRPAGPAAKPLSAETSTQEIREPSLIAGRSSPLASVSAE